jgi:hypothetical protein
LRLKYGGLAIFATVYELMDHEFTGKNELTCPHWNDGNSLLYRVVIEQHVKGKLVGKIVIRTCYKCDSGL